MIFEFRRVSKSFGAMQVIKSMSFSIEARRTTYIIGRSGEGKSVSLKMMVGLILPDQGEIIYRGEDFLAFDAHRMKAYRQTVGFLFQHSALFDSMSVFDNIVFAKKQGRWITGSDEETQLKSEAEEILEIVGLTGAMDVRPSELSVGEKKRVALGRALMTKPDILFYDEPTTGLDPIYAERIDQLISRTKQAYDHLTSVVVSHDVHAALKYGDDIVMLKNGRNYLAGSPQDLLASQDPYIQQFLEGHLFGQPRSSSH